MWYNYTNTLDTALTLHKGGVRHGQRWSKGVKCQPLKVFWAVPAFSEQR